MTEGAAPVSRPACGCAQPGGDKRAEGRDVGLEGLRDTEKNGGGGNATTAGKIVVFHNLFIENVIEFGGAAVLKRSSAEGRNTSAV